jgi:hypothetical protein
MRSDLASFIAEYLTEHPASADPDARLSDVVLRWPEVTVQEFDRALRITGELANMELVEATGDEGA